MALNPEGKWAVETVMPGAVYFSVYAYNDDYVTLKNKTRSHSGDFMSSSLLTAEYFTDEYANRA